jgi:hypothetical protein
MFTELLALVLALVLGVMSVALFESAGEHLVKDRYTSSAVKGCRLLGGVLLAIMYVCLRVIP